MVAAPVGVISVGNWLTVNEVGLTSLPPAALTETVPVVAPAGTVAVIEVEELTVKVGAFVPFTEMDVTPLNAVPVMLKVLPTQALEEILVILGVLAKVIVLAVDEVPQPEFVLLITYTVLAMAVKVRGVVPLAITVPPVLLVLIVIKSVPVEELIK